MNLSIKTTRSSTVANTYPFWVLFISLFICCKKTAVQPAVNPIISDNTGEINFHISQFQDNLIQNNASINFLKLSWEPEGVAAQPGTTFSVEYSLAEFNFSSSATIASTQANSLDITVEQMNEYMCEIIEAGVKDLIKLRIRADMPNGRGVVYSNPVALTIMPYQPFTDYSYPQVIHLPGNFENWKLNTAPHVISVANNGSYEGYINFTNQYPEFLFVKGESWNTSNTFQNIGSNKFGFGGKMFTVPDGEGIYRIRINTNSNTWEAAKINNWEVYGSALPDSMHVDHVMQFNQGTVSWSLTVPLVKGWFRIRANEGDNISFGHIHTNGYIKPDYQGDDFDIPEEGIYKIILNLSNAGNYSCQVIRWDPGHHQSDAN